MPDFYEDAGYAMPPEAGEVKSDSFEYYKHPAGIYRGVFGKLTAKYKDSNGKKCEGADVGAKLTHFTAALWILEYKGKVNAPESKPMIAFVNNSFALPTGVQPAEVYFPLMVSYDPKDQWKVQKLFESFAIPGHDNLRLVKLNPSKPTEKITNFQAFPSYYGMPIEWIIDLGAQKGSPYCSSIKMLVTPRYPQEAIATMEKEVEHIIELERAKHKESQSNSYTAPPPPSTDLESLLEDGDDIFSKG